MISLIDINIQYESALYIRIVLSSILYSKYREASLLTNGINSYLSFNMHSIGYLFFDALSFFKVQEYESSTMTPIYLLQLSSTCSERP
jgi:hypothetical protein